MKLGRLPQRHDARTLHLADFIKPTTAKRGGLFDLFRRAFAPKRRPVPPPARDWTAGMPEDLGMMANADYGCCGFAGMGHKVQVDTAAHGAMVTPTDADVLAAYAGCTGFKPNDPSTDQGVVLIDALKYWRTVGLAGHKIGAYVRVDCKNLEHLRLAIDWFGGVYTGAALPLSVRGVTTPWLGAHGSLTGDNAADSYGGHCMLCVRYTADGKYTFVTWGRRQDADEQWILDYVDEAWAVISNDWLDDHSLAPSGLDMVALTAALADVS